MPLLNRDGATEQSICFSGNLSTYFWGWASLKPISCPKELKMIKRATLVWSVLLLVACGVRDLRGSGDLITAPWEVSGFDRIRVTGSGDVVIAQDGTESITVETDDNLMRYVTAKVKGRTLELGFEEGTTVSPTRLTFELHLKELTRLVISGSADIEAERIETNQLEIDISGSGDIRIDALTADNLEIDIGGSGDVDLAGEVERQEISIGGSGKVRAAELASQRADVSIGGSGDATVWAVEYLDVAISGSESVDYYGNPSTDLSGQGSGDVRSRGEK